jgi:hypothetical protein
MPERETEPTVREATPAEVRAQLKMNLAMLAAAAEVYGTLTAEHRARIEAMTVEQAHVQFVAALALLPPATRNRVERCNRFLLSRTPEVS